eukprot:5642495-Amphidinium_carterae.1
MSLESQDHVTLKLIAVVLWLAFYRLESLVFFRVYHSGTTQTLDNAAAIHQYLLYLSLLVRLTKDVSQVWPRHFGAQLLCIIEVVVQDLPTYGEVTIVEGVLPQSI